MTVIFSKKCELAIQATLYLSAFSNDNLINSEKISKELKAPKEFVSKVLQILTLSGIIGSKKGKDGGFFLAKDASDIKLIDIVEAIDGLESFKTCVLGFPNCSPNGIHCPVHEKWGKIREEALAMLSSETLEQLRKQTLFKIQNL